MQARLLGWAGVQLRTSTSSLVIDPLADARAVWAAAGALARDVPLPPVVPAEPAGAASVALVTHLHRDHADAAALHAALVAGAPVLLPEPLDGSPLEDAATLAADAELQAAGLGVRTVVAWETVVVGEWTITALPAVDGTGDAQVSWLVRAGDAAVVHAGDSLNHGWWWRIAARADTPIGVAFLPVNASVASFPHRRPSSPLPVVMGGAEAAVAAHLLGAARAVAIHADGYHFPPVYVPDPHGRAALAATAAELGVAVAEPELGVWFDVPATSA